MRYRCWLISEKGSMHNGVHTTHCLHMDRPLPNNITLSLQSVPSFRYWPEFIRLLAVLVNCCKLISRWLPEVCCVHALYDHLLVVTFSPSFTIGLPPRSVIPTQWHTTPNRFIVLCHGTNWHSLQLFNFNCIWLYKCGASLRLCVTCNKSSLADASVTFVPNVQYY